MATFRETVKKLLVLNGLTTAILVLAVCLLIIPALYYSQIWSEVTSPPIPTTGPKEQFEIAKLAAEIRQIRSDTSGSLFWLKMIALFVTVGGAVGGYLVGQNRVAKRRIEFENRKNIEAVYQTIVQELSDQSPLLRAAAAVKLGNILKSFPAEWAKDDSAGKAWKHQLIQLTKQVLAASLAIEKDSKVLKTLSIALVLDRPETLTGNETQKQYADARKLDLSGARADEAYWKLVDFSESDFYKASLKGASFRQSLLHYSQFRESSLSHSVFFDADCAGAVFKLADLRNADLTEAKLYNTTFENAKIHGCKLTGIKLGGGDNHPMDKVDDSVYGDGTKMITVGEWLARETKASS
jgi:hypothetical protein